MAHSFFTGTDIELYTGSAAFSAKISLTPQAFGLLESQAAEYASLNAIYADCYLAVMNPEKRTTPRVVGKNDVRARLRVMASDLAKIIDGTATVTDAQKVELGLNVRALPSPLPPPGTPEGFRVTLLGDGSIELKWTCKNPPGSRGTIYQIWRRVGGETEFTYLGGSGAKRYVERAIPAGVTSLTYQVQAVRSKSAGPRAQYTVNFGAGAGATMTAAATAAQAPKIAA
ncbi:MAG TPA: hypothetical protein VGR35_16765 [Tepidisphaeraceae bacterium]|nr:hypothetical protein [Tepidisphaeraceae bacterium]